MRVTPTSGPGLDYSPAPLPLRTTHLLSHCTGTACHHHLAQSFIEETRDREQGARGKGLAGNHNCFTTLQLQSLEQLRPPSLKGGEGGGEAPNFLILLSLHQFSLCVLPSLTVVYLLPSVSDVSLGFSVCLSACLSLSFSSDVWLESGSQPRDGVGVEVVDLGFVTPRRWSSFLSQPAFFEARTG